MKILISGQGFAGSLLAWFLIQEGLDVTVIDRKDRFSSTRVSAGIMLPVTGRRLAKTQNADVIIPFAHELYRSIESVTGGSFFTPKNVLQIFTSIANRNEWYARSADPGMELYVGEILNTGQIHHSVKNEHGGIILKQSGSVNPLHFLEIIRNYILKNGKFLDDELDFSQLKIFESNVSYNNIIYDFVVLSEGSFARTNNLFDYLPFKPAKGEILDFYSKNLSEENIIVNGNYILPMSNNNFRIGATYEWDNLDSEISTAAKIELETNLRSLINCDFSITDQKAGIRPSVRDRRPLIGFHPQFKNVAIFNGLGTKGAMQGPFYAKQMADLLISNKYPDADVNIRRFESLYREP